MASIIDSFQESINEKLAYLKIAVYAIPVYFLTKMYMTGKMQMFFSCLAIVGLLAIGLMAQGINNVRMNKTDVLTLNPLKIMWVLFKSLIVLVPQGLVLGYIGYIIIKFVLIFNIEIPHYELIVNIIVWTLIGSILLTSFMSFAKYLRIQEGYNFKVICESCVDVFLSALFFIPQLAIVDLIVFGPVHLVFNHFNIPTSHWGYVAFFSIVVVINFSMLTNYFAQSAYEQIKGNNEDYDDNYNKIDVIDDAANRMNGR